MKAIRDHEVAAHTGVCLHEEHGGVVTRVSAPVDGDRVDELDLLDVEFAQLPGA